VYEQAARFSEVGAGLQLAPNATRLLLRLGITSIAAAGVRPFAIQLRRWDDGRLLGETVLGSTCIDLYGAPYCTLHRADLHSCLLDLLPADALSLDHRLVRIEQHADETELNFANGARAIADVVIGADGIHSVVRQELVSDTARFSGQLMYRGLVSADRLPCLPSIPTVALWLGPGRHCVYYPISAGRWMSFAASAPADGQQTESWTEPGDIIDLAEGYSGWHPEVQALFSAAEEVRRWVLHDRDPISAWTSGRLAIVGDAAHPMLPFFAQGANQAVEDAFVLAECLREAGRDSVGEALLRYQHLRQPRVNEVHRRSRANQQTLHLSDEQRLPELQDNAWLYAYDAESAVRHEVVR